MSTVALGFCSMINTNPPGHSVILDAHSSFVKQNATPALMTTLISRAPIRSTVLHPIWNFPSALRLVFYPVVILLLDGFQCHVTVFELWSYAHRKKSHHGIPTVPSCSTFRIRAWRKTSICDSSPASHRPKLKLRQTGVRLRLSIIIKGSRNAEVRSRENT